MKRIQTMDRTTVQDALNPDCPIRNVLARIGDKWSLLVIVTLSGARTMRFGALQRAIPDISQKMLSVTAHARRGRLPHAAGLSRSPAAGGVQPYVPRAVAAGVHRSARRVGQCEYGRYSQRPPDCTRGAVTRRRDPFRCGTGDRRTTTPRPAAISCSRAGRRVPGCAVLEMPSAVTAAGTRR